MPDQPLDVAIVDHSLGNLYSVKHACGHVGLHAEITSSTEAIANARSVILPGVGAYGDAMATLHRLDLVSVLRDFAASGKPLIGICLGVQLLMTESFEFGHHQGLDLITGQVVPFDHPREGDRALKVPQIGWNRICRAGQARWEAPGSLLNDIDDGEYMYFVHSYIVQPQDPDVILSTSRYGQIEFCSSLQRGNVFACQFHPERSSNAGLRMYQNLAAQIKPTAQGEK
jgi:glutamine amidotransferase